jgi:hypothetical protein
MAMKSILVLILCFLFENAFAQVGEWTWMGGDNVAQSAGNYGTQGIPSVANYPPAVYEPCEFQDQQGNFWVFGGFSSIYNSDMADLWKYDPATKEWTWMKGIGTLSNAIDSGYYGTMGVSSPLNRPSGRGWGTPSWSDTSGNFWIYGGPFNCADLWKYTLATNEWTWMQGSCWSFDQANYGTFQVPAATNTPGIRRETSATWTDANGNLWLFGGQGIDSTISGWVHFNDMWKFDVSINQWVWMNGSNYPNDNGYYGVKGVASPLNKPPSRFAFAKWKDPSGNFYLFGGLRIFGTSCALSGYNDVWKYDISLNNWIWIGGDSTVNSAGSYAAECVTLSSNMPRNSYENRSVCSDSSGNVFMYGSFGVANCTTYSSNSNELWQYSTIHNEWTLLRQDGPVVWGMKGIPSPLNAPPKTFGTAAWYRNNEMWLFGGSDAGNFNSYNSVWRYTIDSDCYPTGISESTSSHEAVIYPNPFSDQLNVEVDRSEQMEIVLYDISGRKIMEQKFRSTVTLNTEHLAKGIYLYEVRSKDGLFQNGKVVKSQNQQ